MWSHSQIRGFVKLLTLTSKSGTQQTSIMDKRDKIKELTEKESKVAQEQLVQLRTVFDQFGESFILLSTDLLDTDNNGKLDPNELRALMLSIDENPMSTDDIEEMIKAADWDGDGLIDFNEFKLQML
jgi:Ca2+-binding EF-hand superfamily protein